MIIAEQIPTKIAPDVIKNSSNKIIHRIVAKDDQEVISNMIGMDNKDAIYLGDQLKGHALCHTEGMRLPISVVFPPVTGIDKKDGDIRRQAINNDNKGLYILKNRLFPCLTDIDVEILKLLNSFLTFNEDAIKGSIILIKKKAKSLVKLHEPHLLKENQYNEAEAAIITEFIIKYLFAGIYYVEKLPEGLMKKIQYAILNPYDKPVRDLRAAFIEIDNKNDMAVHAVSELVINYIYTHQNRNIDTDKMIRSYFIKIDEPVISRITAKIKEREGQTNGN